MFDEVYWTMHKGFTTLGTGVAYKISHPEGFIRYLGRQHPDWTHGTYAVKGGPPRAKRIGIVWRKRLGPKDTVDHAFNEEVKRKDPPKSESTHEIIRRYKKWLREKKWTRPPNRPARTSKSS
jgi:hypothetical protein